MENLRSGLSSAVADGCFWPSICQPKCKISVFFDLKSHFSPALSMPLETNLNSTGMRKTQIVAKMRNRKISNFFKSDRKWARNKSFKFTNPWKRRLSCRSLRGRLRRFSTFLTADLKDSFLSKELKGRESVGLHAQIYEAPLVEKKGGEQRFHVRNLNLIGN